MPVRVRVSALPLGGPGSTPGRLLSKAIGVTVAPPKMYTNRMIEYKPDLDIFDSEADILVNAVNRVGVMGSGIALAFKERYPEMYQDYRQFCEKKMNVHEDWSYHVWIAPGNRVMVFNLPTKDHWKEPSSMELIRNGLNGLAIVAKVWKSPQEELSVAIPKLGCGVGRLRWEDVGPVIHACLETVPEVRWIILGPEVSG